MEQGKDNAARTEISALLIPLELEVWLDFISILGIEDMTMNIQ